MKNKKSMPMRLVTSWVWIEESDLDPVISAPSSDTNKGKYRLNSFNTIDDYYTILYYTEFPYVEHPWCDFNSSRARKFGQIHTLYSWLGVMVINYTLFMEQTNSCVVVFSGNSDQATDIFSGICLQGGNRNFL